MSETEQKFEFTQEDAPSTWKVTVSSDEVVARYGLRTYTVPIDQLRHVYANLVEPGEDADKSMLGFDYASVILCYEDPAKEKLRNVTMTADRDSEEARQFVKAVLSLRPDTDIRHMEHKEALELMGTRDYTRIAIIAIGAILGLVVLLGLAAVVVEGF